MGFRNDILGIDLQDRGLRIASTKSEDEHSIRSEDLRLKSGITLALRGRGKRVALSKVPLEGTVMRFRSLIPQSNFRPGPGNKLT